MSRAELTLHLLLLLHAVEMGFPVGWAERTTSVDGKVPMNAAETTLVECDYHTLAAPQDDTDSDGSSTTSTRASSCPFSVRIEQVEPHAALARVTDAHLDHDHNFELPDGAIDELLSECSSWYEEQDTAVEAKAVYELKTTRRRFNAWCRSAPVEADKQISRQDQVVADFRKFLAADKSRRLLAEAQDRRWLISDDEVSTSVVDDAGLGLTFLPLARSAAPSSRTTAPLHRLLRIEESATGSERLRGSVCRKPCRPSRQGNVARCACLSSLPLTADDVNVLRTGCIADVGSPCRSRPRRLKLLQVQLLVPLRPPPRRPADLEHPRPCRASRPARHQARDLAPRQARDVRQLTRARRRDLRARCSTWPTRTRTTSSRSARSTLCAVFELLSHTLMTRC